MTAPGPRESRIPLTASGPAIHLVEWGRPDGFPVVFLHGGAHDASRWAGVCRRLPDTYLWIEAYGLDALCGAAVEHGDASAKRWVGELEAIAASRGLHDLLVRATVYRARLGEPGAFEAARSLAAQVDNPALDELLASAA